MLTRFYKKGQIWVPGENDLELEYVDIPMEEAFNRDDLVPSVFCILPADHPKNPGYVDEEVSEIDEPPLIVDEPIDVSEDDEPLSVDSLEQIAQELDKAEIAEPKAAPAKKKARKKAVKKAVKKK